MSPVNNRSDITHVLQQMKAMREAAGGDLAAQMRSAAAADARNATGVSDVERSSSFQGMFEAAMNRVNEAQMESSRKSDAFVRGETDDLVQVMIQGQKANVAFQALTQARNRMVSAYQEIMNMRI